MNKKELVAEIKSTLCDMGGYDILPYTTPEVGCYDSRYVQNANGCIVFGKVSIESGYCETWYSVNKHLSAAELYGTVKLMNLLPEIIKKLEE